MVKLHSKVIVLGLTKADGYTDGPTDRQIDRGRDRPVIESLVCDKKYHLNCAPYWVIYSKATYYTSIIKRHKR